MDLPQALCTHLYKGLYNNLILVIQVFTAAIMFYCAGGQSASRQSEKAAFQSVKSSSPGNQSALSGKLHCF